MTITLDFQTWLDWIIALPLWVKITSPIVLWLIVALIMHKAYGPYDNKKDLEEASFFFALWPIVLSIMILFSPLFIVCGLFKVFGGKIKPKS